MRVHVIRRYARRRGVACALSVAALAACGDNAEPALPHAGSRIQLVYYELPGGPRVLDRSSFYDEVLGERCHVVRFSDGGRYCMPDSAAGETVFADERCSRVLGLVRSDPQPPRYFIRTYESSSGASPSHIYRAGPAADRPALVWTLQNGYCLGPTPSDSGFYFEVSRQFGPENLPRFRETSLLEGNLVAVGVDTTDDGLATFGQFFDRQWGGCELQGLPNSGEVTCIPGESIRPVFFADAQCADPAVSGVGPDLPIVFSDDRSGCSMHLQITDPIETTQLYRSDSGSRPCLPTNIQVSFRPVGTRVAEDRDVARLALVSHQGTTRILPMELVEGTLHVPSQHLFDQELGAECAIVDNGNDHPCVPIASAIITNVFADTSCSKRLALAFVRAGACDPAPAFAADSVDVYPIAAPYEQTFYELDTGDTCSTLPPPPGYRAYSVGPPLDPQTFAHATLEIQR